MGQKVKYKNISASYDVGIAKQFGINSAVLLNKLNYLSEYTSREDGFCWRTAKELEDELGLTKRQQDKVVKKLTEAGIIEVKNTYIVGTQIKCKHFKILEKSESDESEQSDCNKMSQSESDETSQSVYNNQTIETKHNTLSNDKGETPADVSLNVKETLRTNKQEYGNPEINRLYKAWEQTVGFKINSKGKLNRYACHRLIKKHGANAVESMLILVAEANNDRYAPTIENWLALEEKWDKLGIWYKKRQSQRVIL